MEIIENFELKDFSYMKIGGLGAFLIKIYKNEDLAQAIKFAEEKQMQIHVLGHGSNSIFSEAGLKKVFIKFETQNIVKTYENNEFTNILSDAGVDWDELVEWSVKHKLSGLEALSGIPGSVGACPVQNIGAYGQEVSNIITNVKLFDLEEKKFLDFPNQECQFEYRNSIFKKNPSKYIIYQVGFNLKKQEPIIPDYKDIKNYFNKNAKKNPNLAEIRKAILEIRSSKLPDPKIAPNCGSFFENPIVDRFVLSKILMQYPDLGYVEIKTNLESEKKYKIFAGWLIEKAGLKGHDFGKIKVDENNALVLVNHENANFADLIKVIEQIKSKIFNDFGLDLETEPNLITG